MYGIGAHCYIHRVWINPYYCQALGCDEEKGFICADPEENNDADLHIDYIEKVTDWAYQLNKGLGKEGVLSHHDAKSLLAQSSGDGYVFIRKCHLLFHPMLMENPDSLIKSHPHQGSLSYNRYVEAVSFYHKMLAYILDQSLKFDDKHTQRIFIHNLNSSEKILEEYKRGIHSPDAQERDKFTIGRFTTTIGLIAAKFQSSRTPSGYPSSRLPSSAPRSKFIPKSGAKTHQILSSSQGSEVLTIAQVDATGEFPDFESMEELCCFALHDSGIDYDNVSPFEQDMFQSCVYQMVQKKHNFDVSKPCALCGQSGHSFDSCPQVDLSVMKPAYIKLRLLANRIRAVLNDLEKQQPTLNSILAGAATGGGTPIEQRVHQLEIQMAPLCSLLNSTNPAPSTNDDDSASTNGTNDHMNQVFLGGPKI